MPDLADSPLAETLEENWRPQLLRQVTRIAASTTLVGSGVVLATLTTPLRVPIAIFGTAVGLALAVQLRRPWMSQRIQTVVLLTLTTALALMAYAAIGFLAGPATVVAFSTVAAGLLLGRRGLLVTASVSALAIALIGWGIVTRVLPTPAAVDVSLLSPAAWIRTNVVALLALGTIGVMVVNIVERLERTLRHARDESLRRAQAEMERRGAERAAVEAQKLEAVGRLAAGVAHDFNNALLVIEMWNETLRQPDATDEERAAGATAIAKATKQASGLARQLLVLGRRDARSPRRLALGPLVSAYQNTLKRVLPADIVIGVEAPEDAFVMADEVQLHQVLLNLAVNARDAMPAGGRLTLRARRERTTEPQAAVRGAVIPPGDWVVLDVHDSGAGMEEATQRQAFEPFFTTKEPGRGSGLGLATVLSVAEQSQGHMQLWSQPGQGTRFSLWLPHAADPETSAQPVAAAPEASLSGLTVLLVEDTEAVRGLMKQALVSAGCRVLVACDGSEGLTTLAAHQGDLGLVCTDVVMPGTPVSELLRQYKERYPDGRILVCSGYVGEDLTRRGIEEGRYRLLSKPFAADDLLRAVREVMTLPVRS